MVNEHENAFEGMGQQQQPSAPPPSTPTTTRNLRVAALTREIEDTRKELLDMIGAHLEKVRRENPGMEFAQDIEETKKKILDALIREFEKELEGEREASEPQLTLDPAVAQSAQDMDVEMTETEMEASQLTKDPATAQGTQDIDMAVEKPAGATATAAAATPAADMSSAIPQANSLDASVLYPTNIASVLEELDQALKAAAQREQLDEEQAAQEEAYLRNLGLQMQHTLQGLEGHLQRSRHENAPLHTEADELSKEVLDEEIASAERAKISDERVGVAGTWAEQVGAAGPCEPNDEAQLAELALDVEVTELSTGERKQMLEMRGRGEV